MTNGRKRCSELLFGVSLRNMLPSRTAAVSYLALLVVGAVPLVGQTPQGSAQKPAAPRGATSPVGQVYTTKAFDPNMESLPRSYAGMDCVRTIASLKRARLAKSDFETTVAFKKRETEVIGALDLYGGIKASDLLAFRVDLKRQFKPIYNADSETLSLHPQAHDEDGQSLSAIFGKSPDFDFRNYLPVTILSSATSSYLGSNAFGAKTVVRKETGSLCGLIRPDGADGPWFHTDENGVSGNGDVQFDIVGTDARVFLQNPAMLVIGRLVAPYYLTGGLDVHGPTRDKPYDRAISVEGVFLRLEAIWYYDSRSGRVFYKQHTVPKPSSAPEPTWTAAQCEIVREGTTFTFQCESRKYQDGTFIVQGVGGTKLLDTHYNLRVARKDGAHEVRGLSTRGPFDSWGAVTRDSADPSCWVGSSFRVCARPEPKWVAAQCEIVKEGKTYTPLCESRSYQDETFIVQGVGDTKLLDAYYNLKVVRKNGVYEMTGLSTRGSLDSWGAVTRDSADASCWVGSGFRVCARPKT